MTINITLRLPPTLAAHLDQVAGEEGASRHGLIISILSEAVERPGGMSPDLNLGYIELAGGEIDPADVDCPECGQPLERPHVGFVAGARRPLAFGPVCIVCATTT